MRNLIGAVKLLAIGVVISNLTAPIDAQFTRSSKLAGTSANSQEGFSVALSADGNTAILGGWSDSNEVGAVWIFTRSNGTWTQQGAKLTGNDAIGAAHQGWSVAISGDGNTAMVGGSDDNKGVGAAWIYTRTNGVWTQQGKKLTASDASGAASQGFSVALSSDGNTAMVGGGADNSYNGAAWAYTRSAGVWTQQGSKLTPTDASGASVFGYSVALSSDGSTGLIGGIGDGRYAGAAWAYTRTSGVWHQQAKLTANDGFGAAGQGQSVSLSADGNTALVGGSWDKDSIGGGWIYVRTNGAWSQQGPKLSGNDYIGQSLQGDSVSLTSDGNTVVVGGSGDGHGRGAAWTYRRSSGAWSQLGTKLTDTASSATSKQGSSVAVSGDGSTVLVGGPAENNGAGAAWVYSTTISSGPNPTITATAGTPQSAQVNTAFTSMLQVKLLDGSGKAMTGVSVTFTPPASGASATFSPTTPTTDLNGVAAVTATANGQTGSYNVVATASGVPSSVSFALTNTPPAPPPPPPTGTGYITGGTPGSPRQDVTGYVGTQFSVGATPLNVTAVGRIWVSGNSATHIVKLVTASTGADVAGGSATVNMAGGQANQYVYTNLQNPVVLKANTIYYIVSQETSGGDNWLDYGPVTTTAVAGVNRPIGSSGANYIQVAVPPATNQGYSGANFYYTLGSATAPAPPTVSITSPTGGTVSGKDLVVSATAAAAPGLVISTVQFQVDGKTQGAVVTTTPYSIGVDTTTLSEGTHTLSAVATDSAGGITTSATITVTVHNGPTGTPLVTGASYGAARNNAVGWLGYQIDIGSAPLTVIALGRIFVSGNGGSHLVKLVNARDSSDVPGGSVTVNMQGGTVGQYKYTSLPNAVTLQAYNSYLLISQEQYGGDQWYDLSTITLSNVASVEGPIYSSGSSYVLTPMPGVAYVPLNFLYGSAASSAPPTVSISAPAANAVISGKSQAITATATAANNLTIGGVQFKVDGVNVGGPVGASPYTVNLDTTVLTNSAHVLTAVATDSANNSASAQVNVTVNNPPPTVSITSPGQGASISGKNQVVTATATASSGLTIASVQFKVDGAAVGGPVTFSPYSIFLDTTTLSNASHSITAVATDSANNTTSAQINVTVANSVATVSITAPAGGANVSGKNVSVTATAAAAPGLTISSVQFRVDGTNYGAPVTTSPYAITLDTTAFTNGTHALSAVATDSARNTATSSPVSVTVANPLPTASITAPAANANVSGKNVQLTATATAGSGLTVASVQFKVDGTNVGSPVSASPYTATLDTTVLTNAAHLLTAVVTDSANNTATSSSVSVTVLNTVTTVSITAPTAGATVSGKTLQVTATATPGNGLTITNVQFKVDGTNYGSPVTASPYSITVDTTALTNASHSLTAAVTDSSNFTTLSQITVTVSNAVTAVSITAPTAGATVSGKSIAVTATATAAAGLTVTNVQFKVDGTNYGSPVTVSPYSINLDTTTLTNASHSLTAVVTDSGAHTANSTAVSITVANLPPTVSITAPNAGATVSGKTVAISASASAVSGLTITNVQFKVDGTNLGSPVTASPYSVVLDSTTLTNASHSLTAVATDSAGHTNTSNSVSVTVNNAPPAPSGTPFVTSANFGASRNTAVGWVGYQLDVGNAPITVTALGRIIVSGNTGSHQVKLVVALDGTDVPGGGVTVNTSGATAGQYKYASLTAPVTLRAFTSYFLLSQEFYGGDLWYDTSALTVSNLAKVSGPVYSVGSGYALTAMPGYGYVPLNFLSGSAAPIIVPPTVSITVPAANATVSGKSQTVTATASAASGLSISSVQFKVDGTNLGGPVTVSPYTTTLDTTTLTNATHTLSAVATDSANNSSTAQISFTVLNSGTTVTITSPTAGATVSGKTISVAATVAPGSGVTISNVQFKVDGTNQGAPVTVSPYAITLDTTGLTNGTHTLSAVATDTANNATTSQISVTVANAVTTVAITAPAGGSTISGKSVLISATATAATGRTISNVQFKVDGTNQGLPVTVSPYSVTLDTTTLTNGTHTLSAVATDSASATASAQVSVTVSNAAASVFISAPASGASVSGKAATVSATATAGAGLTVSSVQFKVDSTNLGSPVTASPYSILLDTTTLTNASHTISAVMTDSGGGTTTSSAISIIVANLPPTVSITAPAAGATVSGQTVTLSASAAAVSGLSITSVQFVLDGANLGSPDGATPYTFVLDTTTLTNASHTLSAVATDSANHVATSAVVNFTVNNAAPQPGGTPFVTGVNFSSTRNNSVGWVGYQVDIGSAPVQVNALGRMFAPGNFTSHPLKLVLARDSSDVPGGSVTVNMTGGTTGQFVYGNLASPITLLANTSYILVSQESYSGDLWYDSSLISVTGVGTIAGPIYGLGTGYYLTPSPGYGYVPLSFLYGASSQALIKLGVSVSAPSANATISGKSVTVSATANAAVSSIQFKLDGTNVGAPVTASPFTTTFDSTLFANGAHTLTAVATDSTNKTSTSPPVTVTVSNVSTSAVAIPVYGTGVVSGSTLAADGAVDGHYRLIASADGAAPGPNAYIAASNVYPIPPWAANGPSSKWIVPLQNAGANIALGTFTYRITFDLTGFDLTTAVLTGQWACDNSGVMYLNGNTTGAPSTVYYSFTPFTINSGFVAGINTLDFVVTNDGANANPTGLRVDLSGTAKTKN